MFLLTACSSSAWSQITSHFVIIKGAAREAAEVMPWSQNCVRDGQAKSWPEPPGPHRWHDQLQGEKWAK